MNYKSQYVFFSLSRSSKKVVRKYIKALDKKGKISWTSNINRAMAITGNKPARNFCRDKFVYMTEVLRSSF